jgi:hypothetical protein
MLLDSRLDYYRALSDFEMAVGDLERAVGTDLPGFIAVPAREEH